jgi:hypothetical protein
MATRSRGYTSKTRLRGFKKICWVFVEQASYLFLLDLG